MLTARVVVAEKSSVSTPLPDLSIVSLPSALVDHHPAAMLTASNRAVLPPTPTPTNWMV